MLGDKNEDDCEGDSYKTAHVALSNLVEVIHGNKKPASFLFWQVERFIFSELKLAVFVSAFLAGEYH